MSNLPIQFQDKINSPELLAFLRQFGEETYIDAELINKFRDAINELGLIASPDRIITLGTETKVDNVYTYQNYVWSLNNIEYTNTTPDALTIAPATTGFKRKDISVFTNNGTIEIVQGIETDGPTVTTPEVPAGTLYFKFYDIDGATVVDDPTIPIVGAEFVSKAEFKTYEDTISTGENVFILSNKGSNIDLKNSGLISIAGLNISGRSTTEGMVYQGKQFTLRNLTGNSILIKHDQIVTSVERPFLIKDGLDITFPNNEMIRFDYSSDGMREIFKSWSAAGSDIIEVANLAALPATGEASKIYITIDTNLQYRWTGSAYVQIGGINQDLFPIKYLYQATGTGLQVLGTNAMGFAGTQTNVAGLDNMSYYKIASAATAGTTISAREASFVRVSTSLGFSYRARIKISDASYISDVRGFHGLQFSSGFSNTEISASTQPMLGFGCDGTDLNWQIFRQPSTFGGVTKTDLGSNFPKISSGLYLISMQRKPGSSTINWSVKNLTNGAIATGSTTLFTNVTIVNHRNNNTSNISCAFEIQRIELNISD